MKISLKGVSFDDTFKARKAARVPKWFPKWNVVKLEKGRQRYQGTKEIEGTFNLKMDNLNKGDDPIAVF